MVDAEDRKVIHLLDVATSKSIATLSGHTNDVNSVHFSPDGKTLASRKVDRTMRLLNFGYIRMKINIHPYYPGSSVESVHFSPDGKTLMSQDIKQWSLDGLYVHDWAAQAAKDEKRYGLKLEGMKLVPIEPDGK